VTAGLADIHLDDTLPSETVGLKYMRQMVVVVDSCTSLWLMDILATNSQSGAGYAPHRLAGPCRGSCDTSIRSARSITSPSNQQDPDDLVGRIEKNTKRYTGLFCDVVDALMPVPTKDISEHDEVIDVILHQRRERNERMQGERLDGVQEGFPNHLLRR